MIWKLNVKTAMKPATHILENSNSSVNLKTHEIFRFNNFH